MKNSFVACMKNYFGLKQGQTSVEFMKEFKELTVEDRKYFADLLPTVGYEVTGAQAAA
jgi:hypothetical protein